MSVSQLFYKGISGILIVVFLLVTGHRAEAQCTTCPEEQVQLVYAADNLTPAQGDQICYTITVRDFQSVVTFLFSVNFSSSSLRLIDVNTVMSGLPSFTASSVFNPTPATGLDILRVLWSAPGLQGECLDDDAVLMEICFEVIGNPGDPILFDVNNNGFNGSSVEFISEDSSGMTCPVSSLVPMDGPLDSLSVPKSVTPNCMGVPQLFRRSICGTQAGFMDGVAELNVLCGTTPYTVNVSNGETFTTQDSIILIDSLLEGSYTVTVTDASGAVSDPFEIVIDQSTPLMVDARLRPPRCPSDNSGSVILTVTGGQPYASGEYRFNWNNEIFGIGANQFVSLSNGTYPVSIQDSIGCTVREVFVYDTQDPEPIVRDVDIRDAFCDSRNNGQIVVEGRGGSPFDGVGYNFTLTGITDDGVMVDNFSAQTLGGWPFGNLAAGNYVIGIEDSIQARSGNCPMVFTDTIRVDYSRDYSISVTGGDVSGCTMGGRASIDIATSNPPANFNFTITDNTGATAQAGTSSTTTILSDCLPAGMYTISIDDGQGCSTDTTFNLVACSLSTFPVEEPIFCANETGIIRLNASSDSLPITYLWSNGDTTDTVTDLMPGTYQVTITDNANCSLIENFIVDEPDSITLTFASIDPTCPSDSGSITVTPEGGFDPYIYEWSPNPFGTDSDMLSNVPSGTYLVTVTDDDGCEAIDSFTLSSNTQPIAQVSNITTPRCEGDPSGAAAVSVTANADYPGPFMFLSSTGVQGNSMDFSVTDFPSGRNWVVFSDVTSGCLFDTVFIDIPDAAPLMIDDSLSSISEVDCFGAEAIVNLRAVQPNVDFTWPDGDVTSTKLGLSAGTYIVTLTAGLCMSTDTVIVGQPDSLEIFVDTNQSIFPSCGGDNATVVIGTRGGSPEYNYIWENATGNLVSTDTFANNLALGNYSISVTDANGCEAVLPFSVDVATPVIARLDPIIQPACFGEMGVISIDTAFGGAGAAGGYRYQVNTSPAQDISLPFTTQPGDYTIRVFDTEGCSFDTMITIIRPEELLISAGPDQEIELGQSVTLSADITSSIAIDSLIWTAGDAFTCANADCSEITATPTTDQIYTVEVIDVNGCSAFDEVIVSVVRSLNVYVPNIFYPQSTNPLNRAVKIFTGAGVQVIDFFRIYDRWGNLVYLEENMAPQTNGAGNWDGSFNGQDLDPGVYVYVIQLRFDGETEPTIRKGDVTLIR